MLRVEKMKSAEEFFWIYVEGICAESVRLVIVIDKRVIGLNLEKNTLIKQNVETWFVEVRDAQSARRWRVSLRIWKKKKQTFMIDYFLANYHAAYVGLFED